MAQTNEQIRNQMLTSLYGRRLGLTKESGPTSDPLAGSFLTGPKDILKVVQDLTTATTGTAVVNHGVSRMMATGSTQGPTQHLLDAPQPGVEKILILNSSSTGSHQFLTTAAGASVLIASLGTTIGVINFLGPTSFVRLMGVTTGQWMLVGQSLYSSTALAQTVTFTTST